jgi:peptide/nickel transport system substrate-binding protein
MWLGIIAAFTLIASACVLRTSRNTPTSTATPFPTGTRETSTTAPAETEGFTYKVGMYKDLNTDNYWAVLGPALSPWDLYVLGNQHPALFRLMYPNILQVPDLADGPANQPEEQTNGMWTVTQGIRRGYMWSDGTEVTAGDLAFTYDVVKDFALGGNWLSLFDLYMPAVEDDPETTDVDESSPVHNGVTDIEALGDYTIKVTFSAKPGITIWQNGVGSAPFMPQHFWQPIVDEARNADDPAAALYAASGESEPSAGGLMYAGREVGVSAENAANPDAYYANSTYTFYADGSFRQANDDRGFDEVYHGDGTGSVTLEYTDGPYAKDVVYEIYGDEKAAVLALKSGEIDFLLSPQGLQQELKEEVQNSPDLSLIASPPNGFEYLAFNMRKAPMNNRAFRRAVGCMIDKESLPQLVQGGIIPAYSLVPPENTFWANPDAEHLCQGYSDQERFDTAVRILKQSGFSWEAEPEYDPVTGNVLPDTGTGMRDPDGHLVPDMKLLAPGDSDPFRSTAAVWIAQWAQMLGIPVTYEPTAYSTVVDTCVFPAADAVQDWDWYVFGWDLGDPSFPAFLVSLFASWNDAATGRLNTTGYADDEVDALSQQLLETTDVDVALDLVHQLDTKIVQDAPYVVLFQTPMWEAYRNTLVFPFTDTLEGLQNLNGLPTAVQVR